MSALRLIRSSWLVVASILAAGTARAGYEATLPVRYLSPEDATQALLVKLSGLTATCSLDPHGAADPATSGFRGTIRVTCRGDEFASKIPAALAAVDVAAPSQRFHIVVLSASRKEGSTPDLPESEKKALADFKRVMSYKSFTPEAETMIACNRNAETQLNDSYRVEFALASPAGSDVVEVRAFRLQALNGVPQGNGASVIRTYLDTSFSIKLGETIVLGSSVSDQTARVVLVTALP